MTDEFQDEEPKSSKLRWVVNDVKHDFNKIAVATHIKKAEDTE